MVDALRKLLDSGKLSDEKCRSILRGLDLDEKVDEVDGWSSEEEEEVDEEYLRQAKESRGFDIDSHIRIPAHGIVPCNLGKNEPPSDINLYGRLGLHWFNFEMGRNLQYVQIPKFCNQIDLGYNGEHLRVFTEICRLKTKTPGEGNTSLLDDDAIDESYKGCLPNFLSKVNADDRLRFYEVQEEDICENDWLRLYTEFALYCVWQNNEAEYESSLPVKIKKIIVETFETHREPRLKLKSSNAIFHVSFSAKCRDYISVVRRTTDGKRGHVILEINGWIELSST